MRFPLDCDIKVVTIFYYGRSGSYFLHSLLDSHPNVVSIPPGCLLTFFDYWENHCHLPKNELIKSFVLEYSEMLTPDVSPGNVCYDTIRNLGRDKNITLKVDVNLFIQSLCSLLEPVTTVTRRNLFIAIHLSYYMALGLKIPESFIIVFQAHNYSNDVVIKLLNDFPATKFIHTVRYPIQALGSHIKIHAVNFKEIFGFNATSFFSLIEAAVDGAVEWFPGYNKIARAVRLEDLHTRSPEILLKICEWLDIPWNDSLLESTIAGHAYSFSSSYSGAVNGFTTQTISVTHDDIYTAFDKFRFELLFKDRCQAWKYPVSTFEDDGIVERLMQYPFKMECFFTPEELENGYGQKLRDYLLSAYKNRHAALQPVKLLDCDGENVNCGWGSIFSEKELFCLNAVFNKAAFEMYYDNAVNSYANNDPERSHMMLTYALLLKPDSTEALSLLNKIRREFD